MEDAFSKVQEIITDQIRILEAQCNAFVDATAAENRSLKKQLQTYIGKSIQDEPHKQSSRAAKISCLPHTGELAPPARKPADLLTEFLWAEESFQVSTSNSGGTLHANVEFTKSQSNSTSPRGRSDDASTIAGTRASKTGSGLRVSKAGSGLRVSMAASGPKRVSFADYPNLRESSHSLVVSTSSCEESSLNFQPSLSYVKSRYARFFQRYHVRQSWCDNEYDNLYLQDLIQQERLENCIVARQSGASRASSFALAASVKKDLSMVGQPWFILHPDSMFRAIWILACVLLLAYDIITVPFVICFEPAESGFTTMLVYMVSIFWTADIPLNFITGVRTIDGVEVRFQRIACLYAKSWLMFDILLVLPEWLTVAIGNQFRSHSMLRLARWARLTRLLRMARIMRFANLRPVVRHIAYKYHLSKFYVLVTQGWLGTSIALVLFLHITSCVWYLLGKTFDNGWVEANGLSDADVGKKYVISTRWTLCRLQGLFSNYSLTSTADMLADLFLILSNFFLVSFYVSKMTAVTMTRVTDKCSSLWEKGIGFVQRHSVSPELSFRLEKALEATHYAGALETASDEKTLLEALPASLQQDLIYEARKDIVSSNIFFQNLSFNRPATRHICNQAIAVLIAVQEEVLFTSADACRSMLFICSGRSKYAIGFDASYDHAQELEQGCFISEPVLWTTWEHKGQMKSVEESVMLALDAHKFADVILQHKGPNMVAVRYAKHFVWRMNQATNLHDMAAFPELTLTELDTALFVGTDEDHFIFISHYKVEAGTEATLMRDLLVPMLAADRNNQANNFLSPIFIDSEDLSDLSRLKGHVVGSASLVLLLTPGLLSRPWCLIEIVTALENDVNIVPVEVQRPGSSYCYPDEAFYASLRDGCFLSKNSVQLLATEGISLLQVEAAVRSVFLKIACPFSPHKTKAIREAELDAIFKRCNSTGIESTSSKSTAASSIQLKRYRA